METFVTRLQAKDYFPGIRDVDLPKFILVCDFERFRLYDLEETTTVDFKLSELVSNVQHFAYLLGYQKKVYKEQDPANIKAAELMGKLHDRLEEIGYRDHKLEVYLVRILFYLFAEDTTIFNKQQFQDLIEQRTSEDGSDLAGRPIWLAKRHIREKHRRFRLSYSTFQPCPLTFSFTIRSRSILPSIFFHQNSRSDLMMNLLISQSLP